MDLDIIQMKKLKLLYFLGEGDSNLINNNEKALDIVDWIDEVVKDDLKRSYSDGY